MTSQQLPVWDTIKSAWETTYGSKATFWAGIGIMFAVMLCLGFIEGLLGSGAEAIIKIISNILGYFMQLGLIYMGICRAQNKPINFEMLFYAFKSPIATRVIGLYILQFLIMLAIMIPAIIVIVASGAIAAFAGGLGKLLAGIVILLVFATLVFVGARIFLSMGLVLDQSYGPWNAIKKSFAITEGHVWSLIGIFILQSIIIFISAIPLGIGLIWTIPFGLVCYGTIFKRLYQV